MSRGRFGLQRWLHRSVYLEKRRRWWVRVVERNWHLREQSSRSDSPHPNYLHGRGEGAVLHVFPYYTVVGGTRAEMSPAKEGGPSFVGYSPSLIAAPPPPT